MPKVTDKTLHEASSNGDGTYNGAKVVQWLFEAVAGKAMSDADAETLIAEAYAKALQKKVFG